MHARRTEAEVAVILREFEKQTDAFRHRVRGTALWQLIRFDVSLRLQGLSLERAPVGRRRLVLGVARSAWQFLKLPTSIYLGKTFDSAFRKKGTNGYQDVYFDDLRSTLPGLSTMSSCDAAGYENNVENAAAPPIFDDTGIIALSAILGRIFPVSRGEAAFQNLSADLEAHLKIDRYDLKTVARVYNVFAWRVLLYRIALARIKPRAVLCPDNGQFALMKAAEVEDIPFVEMQHGVYSDAHPNALPADLTPDEADGLLMPARLAVYGRFSMAKLENSWLAANGRLYPVGAPFLSEARTLRKSSSIPSGVPRLVLTTQGIGRQELADFVTQFLIQCAAPFELIVKLHPAYDSDEAFYENAFGRDKRVSVQSGNAAESTHSLIARSNLHISVSSACHFDSLGIGTPTGILKLETYETVLGLTAMDGAILIESPADMARIVTLRTFGVVPVETSSYFFEPDFQKQFTRLLQSATSQFDTGLARSD